MIDTIEFVLHGVNDKSIDLAPDTLNAQKYSNDFNRFLYERLLAYEGHYIETNVKYLHDKMLINPTDSQFYSQSIKKVGFVSRPINVINSRQKTEFFYPQIRGKFFTPSHDYHTTYSISENTNSITFNLSIPKYFYNHNVAQWIPNIESDEFKKAPFYLCSFDGQLKILRRRLMEFIYTFFDDLSRVLKLHIFDFCIENIEVKRLDLCYNQIFPSNAFVQDFLNAQREVKNSRIRKNSIVTQSYEHAFNYRHSTDGFYFKIYIKGEEFKVNDFPRLNKENKEYIEKEKDSFYPHLADIFKKHFPEVYKHYNGKVEDKMFDFYENYSKNGVHISFTDEFEAELPFKTAFLLREAMKVLRYEMSFTRKYMSTLYKREIFRKNCMHWKKLKKSHDYIKRYDLSLSRDSREKANEFKRRYGLTAVDRSNYEIMDKSLHKKHKFFLVTDSKIQAHEKTFVDYNKLITYKNYKILEQEEASLSDDLLKVLFKKFREEIEFYQVKNLEQPKSILEAIDNYNIKAEQKQQTYIKQFGEEAFRKLTHTEKRKKSLSKLNKTRIKIILDQMDKGQSLKEVCSNMGMSASSRNTLEHDLKKFNVFRNTMRQKFNYSELKTDFKPYYDKFFIDKRYFFKIFHEPQLIGFDTIRKNF